MSSSSKLGATSTSHNSLAVVITGATDHVSHLVHVEHRGHRHFSFQTETGRTHRVDAQTPALHGGSMLVECEQLSKSEGSHTGNRTDNEERSLGKFLSDQLLLGSIGPQTNELLMSPCSDRRCETRSDSERNHH